MSTHTNAHWKHFFILAKLTKFPPHWDFSLTALQKYAKKHSQKRIKAFLQQVVMPVFYIFLPTARPDILHGWSYETDLALLHWLANCSIQPGVWFWLLAYFLFNTVLPKVDWHKIALVLLVWKQLSQRRGCRWSSRHIINKRRSYSIYAHSPLITGKCFPVAPWSGAPSSQMTSLKPLFIYSFVYLVLSKQYFY